jgi:hypothetical protein
MFIAFVGFTLLAAAVAMYRFVYDMQYFDDASGCGISIATSRRVQFIVPQFDPLQFLPFIGRKCNYFLIPLNENVIEKCLK